MTKAELKVFLDEKADFYNTPEFIKEDPISIPRQFIKKRDIEITGFLIAIMAWGNRKSILKSGNRLLKVLEFQPYEFILNHSEKDLKACEGFVHRTFNELDLMYFLQALKQIYLNYDSLEEFFVKHKTGNNLQVTISRFKQEFLSFGAPQRTYKHISDPLKNSAAKRINMMLRWFVRKDENGVDFGIWNKISPSELSCPLDVHSGRVARQLKLLKRKQNDAKAVAELDKNLRKLDPYDPVKYDFALFGLGVYEKY